MSNNPVCFSHVGLSVANIEEAIAFYQEVFGWYHIAGPFQITRDGRGRGFLRPPVRSRRQAMGLVPPRAHEHLRSSDTRRTLLSERDNAPVPLSPAPGT